MCLEEVETVLERSKDSELLLQITVLNVKGDEDESTPYFIRVSFDSVIAGALCLCCLDRGRTGRR